MKYTTPWHNYVNAMNRIKACIYDFTGPIKIKLSKLCWPISKIC